jgi:hypothetical protein
MNGFDGNAGRGAPRAGDGASASAARPASSQASLKKGVKNRIFESVLVPIK